MAGIKISYYLQKAQESATDAEILQILLNTYFDYFAVLAVKTVLQIETENLENLKTNLELARIRVNSGSASRAEILRWESEVATANQTVVEANTNILNAKFQLNTSLANTLDDEFDIADVTVEDAVYRQFSQNLIAQFIDNPQDIVIVSKFLVDETISARLILVDIETFKSIYLVYRGKAQRIPQKKNEPAGAKVRQKTI